MEYECPHYVQLQKSKCLAESDLTHLSLNDEAITERSESLTENPNTQIRSGLWIYSFHDYALHCIFICSLQFAEKRAEDSSSSSTEAAHSSDTDVPLCIHDLCSSLEVCVFYTFHTINKLYHNSNTWTLISGGNLWREDVDKLRRTLMFCTMHFILIY